MGRLKIEKIYYEGDNYRYESPVFNDGINIIEGSNGTGKSTFSNLISFVLGNYVKEFDKNKSNVHIQIVNDTNNYVLAKVVIDDETFNIKRFFNDNKIFVEHEGEVKDFLIYRPHKDVIIFSDWLLEKLDIEVVEFYQGTARSKLNFSDLFRLVYYDQKTAPEKIYKESRNDRNFISDSEFIRKVIFQMLMGHEFTEYYRLIGDLNKSKKKKSNYKAKKQSFVEIAAEFGFENLNKKSLSELQNELSDNHLRLQRLETYEEELITNQKKQTIDESKMRQLKKKLVDQEMHIEKITDKINRTYREISNIKQLKENAVLEVTQIKKIILTHNELNLFSPDTCPYCLNKVEREEDHCICGNKVNESEYEKFFYSSVEYLEILKSKQKSIETLEIAIQSCNEELSEMENALMETVAQKENLQQLIKESKEDIVGNTNYAELKEIQQKKLTIKQRINNLMQNIKVKKNFDELETELIKIENSLSKINDALNKKDKQANDEIKRQVKKFNETYNNLLTSIIDGIEKAKIDSSNYMPIINDGEYKEASSGVPVRLLYYLTLLKRSVSDKGIPFPKFLLIDTPESLGIDNDTFNKTLSKFLEVSKENDFQIILTTGIKKYPEELSEFKRGRSLSKENKLLIKKE